MRWPRDPVNAGFVIGMLLVFVVIVLAVLLSPAGGNH